MKLATLLILVCFSTWLFSQELNQFGHIIDKSDQSQQTIQGKHVASKVSHDLSFQGNTLIELSNGFVTLETTCGNTPTILDFYTNTGIKRASLKYNQTINPTTDQSNRYLYFICNGKTIVLDTETLVEKVIPTKSDIAISKEGEIIFFDNERKVLHTSDNKIELDFIPYAIELDGNGNIYAFGRTVYIFIKGLNTTIQSYKNGTFFETKTIKGNVYWVEKKRTSKTFHFTMNQLLNSKPTKVAQQILDISKTSKKINHYKKESEKILCPLYPDSIDYPFPIGNSYAEYQNYGTIGYLHPGVDIIGFPDQKIYATMDGIVKAVLTTSGYNYWRLALGITGASEEQDGYLFAHLKESSIPFAAGDEIKAGDYIGSLVEWPVADFHHLHFARIEHKGEIWDGNWLTKDNVLSDIVNFKDESAPVFEDLWEGNTIAFRSANGIDILEADSLYGEFDIICHAYDQSNSDWRIDVDKLWFEILDADNNSVVYDQHSFTYDFVLDAYADGFNTISILNTIYSTEGEWICLGDYGDREFYQQISKSNGDGVIDEEDHNIYFDSSTLPDGSYLIRVFAEDAVGNKSSTEQLIEIRNNIVNVDNIEPNSFNVYTSLSAGLINLSIATNQIKYISLSNLTGQLIINEREVFYGDNILNISKNGIYIVKAYNNKKEPIVSRKILIQN